jgi:hypothetical protein
LTVTGTFAVGSSAFSSEDTDRRTGPVSVEAPVPPWAAGVRVTGFLHAVCEEATAWAPPICLRAAHPEREAQTTSLVGGQVDTSDPERALYRFSGQVAYDRPVGD